MNNKIIVIIICFMLITTSFLISSEIPSVRADPGEGEEDILIDESFIRTITENVSIIIKISYDEENGELAKGREFGSKGEHYAAEYLNFTFNTILNIPAYMERIDDESFWYSLEYKGETDEKLNITAEKILLNGDTPIDGYITPRWNDSWRRPLVDPPTYNFSYTQGLPIYKMPEIWWLDSVIENKLETIIYKMIDEEITNLITLLEYIIECLEDEYNFDADTLNSTTLPEEMKDSLDIEMESQGKGDYPMLYIAEDPAFNPNISYPFYITRLEQLRDIIPGSNPFIGILTQLLRHVRKILPLWKWHFCDNLYQCKGLILFDHNNDTYNQKLLSYLVLLLRMR